MTAAGWDQFRKRRNFHWKIGLRYRFPLIEMPQVEKVYAYIVQEERLLVFRHVDYREVGVQVPGGTLEAGETPEAGVLREAGEETGLRGLVLEKCLGRDE